MRTNLREAISEVLYYRFNLDEDKAQENEIIDSIRRNVEFKGTNLWALIFAIFIASIGLNVNSTAVIIGAMLISPLMGPIMGLGLGAGMFDFKLIKFSLKNLFVAVIISLMTSALYFWLSPLQHAQSELLARTTPTIWDVLIALFGGLAGIIASSRKNFSTTIPGVAIATALMPPLCTAGYGLGTGNLYYFLGAFYLFLINSVFISIATFLIIRFLKFQPVDFVDTKTEKKVRRYVWSIAILTILPSMFLAYQFVEQEIFKQNVQRFIRNEIEANDLYLINQRIKPGQRFISLLVYGERNNDSLLSSIRLKKSRYGLEKATIELRQTLSHTAEIKDKMGLTAVTTKIPDLHSAAIIEKDKRIRKLETLVGHNNRRDTTLRTELSALFGEPQELVFQNTLVFNKGVKDSVLFIYLRMPKKVNRKQMGKWLDARYPNDKIKLVIE